MGLAPDGSPFKLRISPYALTYLRERATDLMNCAIIASAPVVAYDALTRRETSGAGSVIYDGPARVWQVPSSAQVLVGEDQVTITQTMLSVPWETPSFSLDTLILVTAADDDDLIGRSLNIESSVRGGGLRASRQFSVSISTSKRVSW
jgi:hypothetical protein